MLFRDLKQGCFAYLIHNEKDNLRVEQVKVVSVGVPYFDQQGVSPVQKVVDFTIARDKGNETYKIPETLSTTCAGTTILFADRDGFLTELETLKNQSEDIINSIEYHKRRKEVIEKALSDYNPTFKEKKDLEDRLNKMENSMSNIEKILQSFVHTNNE